MCRTVLGVFVRALRSAYRRHARREGLRGGETAMVTSIQRFGGAINLHVHFPTLMLDCVFVRQSDDTLVFHPAAPPTAAEVHRVVRRVHRRLARLGLVRALEDVTVDPLGDESAALARLIEAAVVGRAALGGRSGRGPLRLGEDPDAPWVDRKMPLHADEAGFDLHAAVYVPAGDRNRLAQLWRYLCRPPLGQHRLEQLRDGRVARLSRLRSSCHRRIAPTRFAAPRPARTAAT